jgi:RNA polymerase sigma factor (sigma-70 family)
MTSAEKFAKEYLGKVFYFCLKKTGNDDDAEELSSDIAYEVISSLSRGASPENFDAWVWTIARRRWAKFAARKYYKNPEQVDIRDYDDILAADDDVERDVILSEDTLSLRRELAFIRSDYRKILVSHYVDEMSVSEISKKYDIPVGTVKTRLQNSRKILKEGMNMARTFGVRSYNPEDIALSQSGTIKDINPWEAVQRKIPKNILLEASNNPSTIEELAMELGIAVPYMEEEVEILEKSELLKKIDGDKYITSFFIEPRECQEELDELCWQYAERNYEALWKLACKAAERAKEIGASNGTISDEDVKMYFVGNVGFRVYLSPFTNHILVQHFHRKDGGTWGFVGLEKGAKLRPHTPFNNVYNNTNGIYLGGYFANGFGFEKKIYNDFDMVDENRRRMLKQLAVSGGDVSGFSENDTFILNEMINCGLAVKTDDGKVLPRVITIGDKISEIMQPVWADSENTRLKEEMKELAKTAKEIVARYCSDSLKDDFEYYVAKSSFILSRMATLIKERGLYTGNSREFVALMY